MLARTLLAFVCLAFVAGRSRAADRSLSIDFTQSRVEVVVRASLDSFTGELKRFEPAITVDSAGRVTQARVAFHFRDVVTGKEKRDRAMHEWQHSDVHPDGVFVLRQLDPATTPATGLVARGQLTFHGVTREVNFPATVTREGSRYLIDGDATVDTREFGLPIIRMLGVLKVDPLVHVRFHLQGQSED